MTSYQIYRELNNEETEVEEETDELKSLFAVMWYGTRKSAALSMTFLYIFVMPVVNLYLAGHLDEPAVLSGIGFGMTLINIILFGVVVGIAEGATSLFSQAYGASKFEEMGIYLMRTKFVCTVYFAISAIIFLNLDKVMTAAGQDQETSKEAARFCKLMIPGVWAGSMFEIMLRFLTSQFHFKITAIV